VYLANRPFVAFRKKVSPFLISREYLPPARLK
jgi:hypothetical protein